MHKNIRGECAHPSGATDATAALPDSPSPSPAAISYLLSQLAERSRVPDSLGAALDNMLRALAETPDNPALWAQLAQLGQRHLDSRLLRLAAQKALALTEQQTGALRAQALVAMAGVERDSEAIEQAEQYYRQALQHCPDHLPVRLGLGDLLLQWGRVEEAVVQFEAAVKLNPVAGYGALIDARRFPDDPNILLHIEKIARLPSLAGPVRTSLLFKLASAWEHHADYAKAFHLARQANAASRRLLSYQAEQHRRFCSRIRQTFSADFFAARRDFGHASTLPVFVLGMPRSGTTLVEQIIGGHPDIYGAGELGALANVVQSLEQAERHSGSGRAYPECVDEFTAPQSRAFAEKILERLRAYAPTARHVVDKLPHNFENIGLIRLLFPNAPIIHVLREPRAVAVSNYFTDYLVKVGGMGFAYDLSDIGKHLVDYRGLMEHWDSLLFAKPILTLSYEDIVDDVASAARALLAYIGLPWHEAVLDFQNLERGVKTSSAWQIRQPIYQTSKAKWRYYAEFLGPLEAALAEPVTPAAPSAQPLPQGLLQEGIACLKAGKGKEAERLLQRLLERHPKHAAATHFLGMALYQQGSHLKALKRIKQSIALHPNHPSWYRNLALVLDALNLTGEAALAREKSGRMASDNARDSMGEASPNIKMV